MRAKELIKLVDEGDGTNPATMDQAKKRFQSYTKSVLTRDARKSFQGGATWLDIGGHPVVVSADKEFILYFTIDSNGNVTANQGMPPNVSKEQAMSMLQGSNESKENTFKCDNCNHSLKSILPIYRSKCPKCGIGTMVKK